MITKIEIFAPRMQLAGNSTYNESRIDKPFLVRAKVTFVEVDTHATVSHQEQVLFLGAYPTEGDESSRPKIYSSYELGLVANYGGDAWLTEWIEQPEAIAAVEEALKRHALWFSVELTRSHSADYYAQMFLQDELIRGCFFNMEYKL